MERQQPGGVPSLTAALVPLRLPSAGIIGRIVARAISPLRSVDIIAPEENSSHATAGFEKPEFAVVGMTQSENTLLSVRTFPAVAPAAVVSAHLALALGRTDLLALSVANLFSLTDLRNIGQFQGLDTIVCVE